jgi:hypothetical protein
MSPFETWTAIAAFVTIVVAVLWLHHDYRRWEIRRELRIDAERGLRRPEQRHVRVIDRG